MLYVEFRETVLINARRKLLKEPIRRDIRIWTCRRLSTQT